MGFHNDYYGKSITCLAEDLIILFVLQAPRSFV